MKKKTAVVILLYNRPEHTKELLNSIAISKKANNFLFYFFCDGPKNSSDVQKIYKIKKLLFLFKKKFKTKIFFRKNNIGLFENVILSINSVFKQHKKAIILEDDLTVHGLFFEFINKSLSRYENSQKVFQISGYSYPVKNNKKHHFLSLTSCWGWGITKNNWKFFYKFLNNRELLLKNYQNIKNSKLLKHNFNYNDSFDYFSMLDKFFKRKVNSWGIIFYLYLFINKKLTLFPNVSLVKNNGFDGSGNHKSKNNLFNSDIKNINLDNFPNKIVESSIHRLKVENFFKKNLSLYAKIKNLIYEKIT